ncbi:hypothetical protein BDY21DRAFT_356189 [Lineolata rhizophorae]|uniref:WD40-repeat-containing domain protein n=1 Tax=Lineolata rhizophorae TaxID=578093 RepID=A0A6A6NP44_9PEZI|nr:hypothetical protein BDY21DRAFT_356189 [Lineolata rhizophorae]
MALRRSARTSARTKRYTDDPLGELLSDHSSDQGPSLRRRRRSGDSFDWEDEGAEDRDEEGEDDEIRSDMAYEDADDDDDGTEVFDIDTDPDGFFRSSEGHERPFNYLSKMIPVIDDGTARNMSYLCNPESVFNLGTLHNRGISSNLHGIRGRVINLICRFGVSREDVEAALAAARYWFNDSTMPTQTTNDAGSGGLHHSPFYSEELRTRERSEGWRWYLDQGGKDAFTKSQVTELVEPTEAAKYLHFDTQNSLSVLSGPHGSQRISQLDVGCSMNIEPAEAQGPFQNESNDSSQIVSSGWLLYLGSRVKCLEWIPNIEGDVGFLAVSTISPNERPHVPLSEEHNVDSTSPSFTPGPATPSSVEIWSFPLNQNIEVEEHPGLTLVLCMDWGNVRHFKWCPCPPPMTRNSGSQLSDEDTAFEHDSYGLLAGIFGDGRLRVFRVPRPATSSDTTYLRIRRAAFESLPPNSVFTSVAWHSSCILTASCADGSVATFDLRHTVCRSHDAASCIPRPKSSGIAQEFSSSPVPCPFSCIPLHSTYILSAISGYPSRPDLLITNAMSGTMRLTRIAPLSVSPHAETCTGNRTREGPTQAGGVVWCDAAQAIVATNEYSTARIYPIRRFPGSNLLGNVGSAVMCVASGVTHGSILIGTADGRVLMTSAVRRTLKSKADFWLQTWFRAEWRGSTGMGRQANDDDQPEVGSDSMHIDSNGAAGQSKCSHDAACRNAQPVVRVTEGYALTPSIEVAADPTHPLASPGNSTTAKLPKVDVKEPETSVFTTIYDWQNHITALAWNPSVKHGSWAAVGTGAGLLRVKNLAYQPR